MGNPFENQKLPEGWHWEKGNAINDKTGTRFDEYGFDVNGYDEYGNKHSKDRFGDFTGEVIDGITGERYYRSHITLLKSLKSDYGEEVVEKAIKLGIISSSDKRLIGQIGSRELHDIYRKLNSICPTLREHLEFFYGEEVVEKAIELGILYSNVCTIPIGDFDDVELGGIYHLLDEFVQQGGGSGTPLPPSNERE